MTESAQELSSTLGSGAGRVGRNQIPKINIRRIEK